MEKKDLTKGPTHHDIFSALWHTKLQTKDTEKALQKLVIM